MAAVPLHASVLAHEGGWDEILFVLAPLLVFAGLLALARKRAGQLEADRDGVDDRSANPAPEETGQP